MLTIITTHGRWRQEAKEFKVDMSYKMILRSVWARGAPILPTKTNESKGAGHRPGSIDNVIQVIGSFLYLSL